MSAREALTVRIPKELLAEAKRVRDDHESLNELVIQAVDREVRRRDATRAVAAIQRVREEIKETTGWQSDSTRLIRGPREGNERGG